uniref:Polynucleotide kinase PNKP phosphatase domain-containing protein n=1 Tax=viral metagenome TaxID=1070528 RepID=A0A6M3IFR2_9ZZZZ
MVVIFDLDGTLANIEHRRHLVTNGNHNWDKFYEECVNDTPNVPVMMIYKILQKQNDTTMAILSGRSEVVRKQTEDWLDTNFIKYDILKMRPENDYTPDEELKRKWMIEISNREMIFCVFDDRQKVVDMWRQEGLCCFQVAKVDF